MDQNPYQPPIADERSALVSPLDPTRTKEISERIERLNRNSLLFGVVGLVLQGVAQATGGPTGGLLALLGTGLFIYGLSLYARMRSRSGWWGLLGLFSCIGFAVLLLLPKHCHNCDAQTKGKTCARCGAPAPM